MALHALLAALFMLEPKPAPETAPPRPMTVWLEPPFETLSARRRERARGPSRSRVQAPSPDTASPVPAPSSIATDAAPSAPVSGLREGAPGRPALLGLGGCPASGLERLPPEARARCEERLAALGEKPPPRVNFDLTGRYARDARPYLTRPPKNGCKPVAAVKDEPMGQTSATIGVGCAWSF
ncbi:hypothetical protein CSW59_16650 [Caulobacter sp. BP25]|nr:hypothetical protein CSW59_16650 [Caulobacter sp. BP25]